MRYCAVVFALLMLIQAFSTTVLDSAPEETDPSFAQGRDTTSDDDRIPAMNGVDIILEECEVINLTGGEQTQFLGFYDAAPKVVDNGDVVFIADLGECDSNGETHEGFGYFHYILEDKELHQIAVHGQTILGHTLDFNYVAGTIGLIELIANDNGDLVFSAMTIAAGETSSVVMVYYSSTTSIELLAVKYGTTPHGDRVWCGFEELAINDRGNVALLGDELTDEDCYTGGEDDHAYGTIYIHNKPDGSWLDPQISDELNVEVDGGPEFGQNCGGRSCDIKLGYNNHIAFIDDNQAYGYASCTLSVNSLQGSSSTTTVIHIADNWTCYDMELKQINGEGDVLFLLLNDDDMLPDDQRRTIYRYSEGEKNLVAGAGLPIVNGVVNPLSVISGEGDSEWGEMYQLKSEDVWMDEIGNVAFIADTSPESSGEGVSSEELVSIIFHDIPPRLEVEDGVGPTMSMVFSDGQAIFSGNLDIPPHIDDYRFFELTDMGEIAISSDLNYTLQQEASDGNDDLIFLGRNGPEGKLSLVKDPIPTPRGGKWTDIDILDVSNERGMTFWGEIGDAQTDNGEEEGAGRSSHTSTIIAFAVTGDQDLDGLLDDWEAIEGMRLNDWEDNPTTYKLYDVVGNYSSLVSVGARKDHKDIFVEIDYMKANWYTYKPIDEVMKEAIRSFANAPVSNPDGTTGIRLHIIIDEEIPLIHDLDSKDVLGIYDSSIKKRHPGKYRVDYFGTTAQRNADATAIAAWLGQAGPTVRPATELSMKSRVVRYAQYVDLIDGGSCGGRAQLPGDTFLVARTNRDTNTFMHELGHTLGLTHGGTSERSVLYKKLNGDYWKVGHNYKPNYVSSMNYLYGYNMSSNGYATDIADLKDNSDPTDDHGKEFTDPPNGVPDWLDIYQNAERHFGGGWQFENSPDFSRLSYSLSRKWMPRGTGVEPHESHLTEFMETFTHSDSGINAPDMYWAIHSINKTDPSKSGSSRIQKVDWEVGATYKDGKTYWYAPVDWNGDGDYNNDDDNNGIPNYMEDDDADGIPNWEEDGEGMPLGETTEMNVNCHRKDCASKSVEWSLSDLKGWVDWENLDHTVFHSRGGGTGRSATALEPHLSTSYVIDRSGSESVIEIKSSAISDDFNFNDTSLVITFDSYCWDSDGCEMNISIPLGLFDEVVDISLNGSDTGYNQGVDESSRNYILEIPEGQFLTTLILSETVIDPLTAFAASDVSSGLEPLTVAFSATAFGGSPPYGYSWDYGDGSTGSGAAPTHVYQNAGDYTAIVTITDADASTIQRSVVVNVSEEPDEPDDDYDNDGIPNTDDNCPYVANADQADEDEDGIGDICELIITCLTHPQLDLCNDDNMCTTDFCDEDGGCVNVPIDGCEPIDNGVDSDGDGIFDDVDNCPNIANADQADADGDGIGDVCDNCLNIANADQVDTNGNGTGDACDNEQDVTGIGGEGGDDDDGGLLTPELIAAAGVAGISAALILLVVWRNKKERKEEDRMEDFLLQNTGPPVIEDLTVTAIPQSPQTLYSEEGRYE